MELLLFVWLICREFGDYYTKAIDETWYRSAVLQHKVDNESFIYAVPHDDKDDVKEEGDIKVMASHAIFRMDAGKEAPGCVVGFQFEQQAMYRQFKEITSESDVSVWCMQNKNNSKKMIRITFTLRYDISCPSFFISAKIVCAVTMGYMLVMSSIIMAI